MNYSNYFLLPMSLRNFYFNFPIYDYIFSFTLFNFLFILLISLLLSSCFFSKLYSCLFSLFMSSYLFQFYMIFIFISLICLYAYPYPSLILPIFLYTLFYSLFNNLFSSTMVCIILSFPSISYSCLLFIVLKILAYLWSTRSNQPSKSSICLSLISISEYNYCYKVGTFIQIKFYTKIYYELSIIKL